MNRGMKTSLLVALLCVARLGHADPIDLELPHAPPPPAPPGRGMRLSLEDAKTVRATGIALTLAGLAVNAFGALAMADQVPSLHDRFDVGIGSFAMGAVSFGAGVGLWAYGDVETRRAEGTAPMLTPEHRRERGRALKIPGIVFTTLGAIFAAASFIPLGVPTDCQSGEEFCGIGNLFASAALGGTSSVVLGLGIPLLAVGVSEEHKGAVVTIDSVAPKAMNGGGGIGFSGRF